LRARRWNRAALWVAAEAALFCALWVNVLAADAPKNRLTGTCVVQNPLNAASIHSLQTFRGFVDAPEGVNGTMQMRLRHIATGRFWDWTAQQWSDDGLLTIPVTEPGRTPWTVVAPALAEGRYQLECSFRDGTVLERAIVSSFSIDRTPPQISFLPLHDQQVIEDFSEIGGEITKPAEIRFSICRLTEQGLRVGCWNETAWSGAEESSLLNGASSGGFWFPAAGAKLPHAGQIENGSYLVFASAVDRAGNEGRAAITVHKRGTRLVFSGLK